MLTSQLAEKDIQIRKLQQQVEDFSKQRLSRLQHNGPSEGKGGSAGPNSKTELARAKKAVREKEKEISRLRSENSQAYAKSANEEEQDKKVKQLQSQVSSYLKKTQEMKQEIKLKEDKNEQLSKELAKASEAQK